MSNEIQFGFEHRKDLHRAAGQPQVLGSDVTGSWKLRSESRRHSASQKEFTAGFDKRSGPLLSIWDTKLTSEVYPQELTI